LSSVLPAPLKFHGMRDGDEAPESWARTLRTYMEIARKNGLISEAELTEGKAEPIVFYHGGPRPPPRPPAHRVPHLDGDGSEIVELQPSE
jgi:hypothetical protein